MLLPKFGEGVAGEPVPFAFAGGADFVLPAGIGHGGVAHDERALRGGGGQPGLPAAGQGGGVAVEGIDAAQAGVLPPVHAVAVHPAAAQGVDEARFGVGQQRARAAQGHGRAVAAARFGQQALAHLRKLVHVLVAVDEGGGLADLVFKGVHLPRDGFLQRGGGPGAQPAAGHHLPERALPRQAREVKVQADVDARLPQGGQLIGRDAAQAHEAGRVHAPQRGQAAHGLIDGGRQAQVIHVEGDVFHG